MGFGIPAGNSGRRIFLHQERGLQCDANRGKGHQVSAREDDFTFIARKRPNALLVIMYF